VDGVPDVSIHISFVDEVDDVDKDFEAGWRTVDLLSQCEELIVKFVIDVIVGDSRTKIFHPIIQVRLEIRDIDMIDHLRKPEVGHGSSIQLSSGEFFEDCLIRLEMVVHLVLMPDKESQSIRALIQISMSTHTSDLHNCFHGFIELLPGFKNPGKNDVRLHKEQMKSHLIKISSCPPPIWLDWVMNVLKYGFTDSGESLTSHVDLCHYL
jgi:hypothetical protein